MRGRDPYRTPKENPAAATYRGRGAMPGAGSDPKVAHTYKYLKGGSNSLVPKRGTAGLGEVVKLYMGLYASKAPSLKIVS